MARISSAATAHITKLLSGPNGANRNLENLRSAAQQNVLDPGPLQIRAQNAIADLAEHGEAARYPMAMVYCEKVVNSMIEKFRTFSGTVQMTVEVRHSQDRLDGLQDGLELCAEAVAQVLDSNRGNWGVGMYYAGGYQVAFGGVKRGGLNYLQVAKINFEIGVSIS
jgi:hypothetical protein